MAVIIEVFWSIWIYRGVRWALGLLFLYAGVVKVVDLREFASGISDFGLVHPSLLYATAITICVMEMTAGLGLLLDCGSALFLMAGLLMLFLVVLAYGIYLGLDIDCGCLGPGESHTLPTSLAIDVSLLVACVYLYWFRSVRALRHFNPVCIDRPFDVQQGECE